jgi:hypothetical protein
VSRAFSAGFGWLTLFFHSPAMLLDNAWLFPGSLGFAQKFSEVRSEEKPSRKGAKTPRRREKGSRQDNPLLLFSPLPLRLCVFA